MILIKKIKKSPLLCPPCRPSQSLPPQSCYCLYRRTPPPGDLTIKTLLSKTSQNLCHLYLHASIVICVWFKLLIFCVSPVQLPYLWQCRWPQPTCAACCLMCCEATAGALPLPPSSCLFCCLCWSCPPCLPCPRQCKLALAEMVDQYPGWIDLINILSMGRAE